MADITREDIEHIANLAMLNLKEEEVNRYTEDIKNILQYAEMVNNIDTSTIDETIATTEQCNVFRKDEVIECKSREVLLQNAPSQDEGMFRIPKVIN